MRWKTLAALLPVVLLSGSVAQAEDLTEIRSLMEAGRSADALAEVKRHLDGTPIDPEAMFLHGLLLAENQQQEQAMKVYEEIVRLRPDLPEPLNNLAVIQASNGDYEDALETLKEALRTHPAYRTAYENLTKIYGQLASEAYSRALSVDQAHTRSSVELVLLSDMVLPEERVDEALLAAAMRPAATDAPLPIATAPVEDAAESQAEEGAERAPEEPASDPSAEPMAVEGEPFEPAEPAMEPAASQGAEPEEMISEAGVDEPAPEAVSPDEAIAEALDEAQGEAEADTAGPPPANAAPGELADLVEAWARAWSDQRVDDYLYFYASDFSPVGGASREEWEALRRERLSAPSFVKVSVAFLDFETGESGAMVRFNQSYESDTFSDVVTKTLQLVREEGAWKIARETVED